MMTVQERLDRHLGREPRIAEAAFVAPNATVLGDVTLGPDSSVWSLDGPPSEQPA